ncbi:GNAT family protein [Caldisphaera sp.]|uniref:GNAT family N-acetyltransferase n=1 Tax=Caldisphaera sp. TaxID=2060322 RepID=UPI0025C615E6|nr:GNAT family protein [Caldisphaera sp.]
MFINLKDGRIIELREANPKDSEKIIAFWSKLINDFTSYRLFNYTGKLSKPDVLENRIKNKEINIDLAISDNYVVGDVIVTIGPKFGIMLQPHIAEIAYGLSEEFRGTGLIYAQIFSAVSKIDVKYIMAYVDLENIRSIKILENLKCEKKAELPEFIYDNVKKQLKTLLLYMCNKDLLFSEAQKKIKQVGINIKDYHII